MMIDMLLLPKNYTILFSATEQMGGLQMYVV